MESEHYITLYTFGVIMFSIVTLLIFIWAVTVTFYLVVLHKVASSRRYKHFHGWQFYDLDEEGKTGHIWSILDVYRREKLLQKFEKLRVKPPEDITFKALVPKEEREENPLTKHLS